MASGGVLIGGFQVHALLVGFGAAAGGDGGSRSPAEAETVIVGAGNVGLSAALHAGSPGREAVVLDGEAAGYGASTR